MWVDYYKVPIAEIEKMDIVVTDRSSTSAVMVGCLMVSIMFVILVGTAAASMDGFVSGMRQIT